MQREVGVATHNSFMRADLWCGIAGRHQPLALVPMAPLTPTPGAAPRGWSVTEEKKPNGEVETVYTSRTGRQLRSAKEVQHHLKHDVGEARCNEDEALWLTTLERYGSSCRHWAIAAPAHTLPECPVFRPTLE